MMNPSDANSICAAFALLAERYDLEVGKVRALVETAADAAQRRRVNGRRGGRKPVRTATLDLGELRASIWFLGRAADGTDSPPLRRSEAIDRAARQLASPSALKNITGTQKAEFRGLKAAIRAQLDRAGGRRRRRIASGAST